MHPGTPARWFMAFVRKHPVVFALLLVLSACAHDPAATYPQFHEQDLMSCASVQDAAATAEEVDACCEACAHLVRHVGDHALPWMRLAYYERAGALLAVGLFSIGSPLGLWALFARIRRLDRALYVGAAVMVPLLWAGLFYALEPLALHRPEVGLIGADLSIRTASGLDLIGASDELTCAAALGEGADRPGSQCAATLVAYKGLFDDFGPTDPEKGYLGQQLEVRAADAHAFFDRADSKPSADRFAASARQVLAHNDLLSELADARLGLLAVFGPLLVLVALGGALVAWALAVIQSGRQRAGLRTELTAGRPT